MKFKVFIAQMLLACIIFVSSCAEKPIKPSNPASPTPASKPEVPMVGGDQDAHGCKPSTGYQWSEIRGKCIRVFESGIRLDAKAAGLDTATSAFIVFKSDEDDTLVELFMPSEAGSQMLKLDKAADNGAGTWKSAKYKLTQWKGMYTLEDAKGKLLYQGSAVK
jgi:hypothetical protein